MTWKTQVSGWVHGARSRRCPGTSSPLRTVDRGDEPVAEDDDEDGDGPQEVDDPVAGGGGGGREVADGGEVHGHSVTARGARRA